MARKKTKPKPPNAPEAQAFRLSDHMEIVEREAVKFDVPKKRAVTIAAEVETAVLITTTRKESELREVFEQIYDEGVAEREICPVEGCGQILKTIKQALVHMRLHILFESDWRSMRAVARDIEAQVYPTVEQEVVAALTPEARIALAKTLAERRRKLLGPQVGERVLE